MKYRPLGRTGIQVSPYALGTLMFATTMGNDPADSARVIHKALDDGRWRHRQAPVSVPELGECAVCRGRVVVMSGLSA